MPSCLTYRYLNSTLVLVPSTRKGGHTLLSNHHASTYYRNHHGHWCWYAYDRRRAEATQPALPTDLPIQTYAPASTYHQFYR
jgi:hypothetical protein